jgi:lipopolysaccharide/colanic/teichoic acid biosynthesis glycosyltransferase
MDDWNERLGRGLPRSVEAALALAGLVAAAPVIGIAALAVVATSGWPVFFRQTRVGRDGKPFTLVKLRSMRASTGGPQVTARRDPRVTAVGALLRRTKLDELPELWNVLRGDMSFVGPRPEVPGYVDLADPVWARILKVRPGLTDPVTLRLRDEEALMETVAGEERDRYYRETLQPLKLAGYQQYLERRTSWSDLGVICDTILALLPGRRGRQAAQSPTNLSERPPNP